MIVWVDWFWEEIFGVEEKEKKKTKLNPSLLRINWWRRHVSGVKKKKKKKKKKKRGGRRRSVLCFDERKQEWWWVVVALSEAEVGLGEREA